ncbi:hypothetical protein SARC_14259 [Sphaeroforma arctica JP610]|uniref:Uncharacterized protein n=1 Tax=Sphaeroforma arctica JP610 TaxID=667725 RepID=A0A0L0FAR0_9EUKA|nr:hypothetical protein SARC_14259 [Sphaeroforma arctica JP610]KNC73183.1 hypothetical protein SARC_14259 [Sphaeroforma arctica JP610]|eukprot:XP_014147085.1 hypothetical protein SARC_14259 [Sphaeroforma arctica JP610]
MIQTHTNTPVNTNSAHANSPAGTNEQISHTHSVLEGIVVSEADTVDTAMITRKAVQPAQRGGPVRFVRQRQAKGALAKHVHWRTEHMRELNERLRHVLDKPALTESEQAQVQADVEMEKEVASRDVAEQIARMKQRLISACEKKSSLIREQHGVSGRKVQLEWQRGEALKNTVKLVDKCAQVQDDNERMQVCFGLLICDVNISSMLYVCFWL